MAHILVIDDDESLLDMIRLMLSRAGHNLILTDNVRDGIQHAFNDQPDLIIVDVMLPELNGYQVVRVLKKDARTQHIPVLILTALNEREHRDNAEDAGADAFVSKPVTMDILGEEINALLEADQPKGV
jgi:DNA-binding response OmpR family regulator